MKKIQCSYCKTKFDEKDIEILVGRDEDIEVDSFDCPECKLRTLLHVRKY